MVIILTLGPNRNYQTVSLNSETIKQKLSEMRGNWNSEKLIHGLITSPVVDARSCMPYGAAIPFNRTGKKNSLPEDMADFFQQIQTYGDEHKADYALIQNFEFQTGRTTNGLSAVVQLLLEE